MGRTRGDCLSLKGAAVGVAIFLLLGLLGGCASDKSGSNSAHITSISVSPSTKTLAIGQTQQFTVTAKMSDGKQQTGVSASWTSSRTSVATVNATGLATAVAGGTTTITATVKTDSGNVTGTATLNVSSATLVSIDVTPADPSIKSGDTQQFTATGNYSDGSKKPVAASWTSSDTSVATITNLGVATGVAAGTTTITASSSGISGNTTLTVTDVTLLSIAVTPANRTIGTAQTLQFTATGSYSDGSQKVIASPTWTSSDTSVATINASGLATAIAVGTTTITATSGSVSGDTLLTVSSSHTYMGTQSPGDLWSVTVDDMALTFSASNTATSLNYAGTLVALPNGFYKTTLTASTDPSLPIGTNGYAVEVPGAAVVISLGGSTDKPIAAIVAGPCPTTASVSTLTGSLINLGKSSYDSTQSESYSKVTSLLVGTSYQITLQSYLLDGTLRSDSGSLPDGTCANSVITIPDVPQSEGGVATYRIITSSASGASSGGLYVMDMGRNSITNNGEGGALGSSTPLDLTQVGSAFSQSYLGLLFRRNSSPITTFVGFGPGAGTSITGGTYVNLDNDPFNSHGTTITIDLPNKNSNGFLEGTLTDTNGAHAPFVAVITKASGKYYLFGITTDTGTTTPYVVMLVQQ